MKFDQYTEDSTWTQSDAEALSIFMQGETGQKVRQKLLKRIFETAVQATQKTSTPYDSGYAGGWRGAALFIDSHLTIPLWEGELPNQNGDAENQDALIIERYRP